MRLFACRHAAAPIALIAASWLAAACAGDESSASSPPTIDGAGGKIGSGAAGGSTAGGRSGAGAGGVAGKGSGTGVAGLGGSGTAGSPEGGGAGGQAPGGSADDAGAGGASGAEAGGNAGQGGGSGAGAGAAGQGAGSGGVSAGSGGSAGEGGVSGSGGALAGSGGAAGSAGISGSGGSSAGGGGSAGSGGISSGNGGSAGGGSAGSGGAAGYKPWTTLERKIAFGSFIVGWPQVKPCLGPPSTLGYYAFDVFAQVPGAPSSLDQGDVSTPLAVPLRSSLVFVEADADCATGARLAIPLQDLDNFSGESATIFAFGTPEKPQLSWLFPNTTTPAPGKSTLRFFHASTLPFYLSLGTYEKPTFTALFFDANAGMASTQGSSEGNVMDENAYRVLPPGVLELFLSSSPKASVKPNFRTTEDVAWTADAVQSMYVSGHDAYHQHIVTCDERTNVGGKQVCQRAPLVVQPP